MPNMGGKSNGRFMKWNFSFYRNSSSKPPPPSTPPPPPQPPPEYLCPICNSLISEPVVVGSGHTFDRLCVQVCQDLNFSPSLSDGITPDFSTVIPNLALKSAIPKWCDENAAASPPAREYADVERIVEGLIERRREKELIRPSERFLIEAVKEKPDLDVSHAVTELTHRVNRLDFNCSTSSDESVIATTTPMTPLPFTTKPACWSPFASSSSEITNYDENLNPNPNPGNPNFSPDEEFVAKLKSSDPYDQEQGAISLRKLTKSDEHSRIKVCTPRLLNSLRLMLSSSYEKVQINAIAALVNLSLEKENKIKIVRSGILPAIIDLLKSRSSEAQEHAAGAIFSLSLEDNNKTAIGVLGALPPLLNCLMRSESERTRSDSALALYHLSLVHSNRVKLVRLGATAALLSVMTTEGEGIAGRVLLVVCQLAVGPEGKAALLEGKAVEHLVTMLRRGELGSESTRENCVAALYALSHGSMRFKALAKQAKAVEVLKEVERTGSQRAKEKARRLLLMLKGRGPESEGGNKEVDWEAILGSDGLSLTRHRVGIGNVGGIVGKSTEF